MGIWEEEYNADIFKEFDENSGNEEPTDEQLIKHDNFVKCLNCKGNVLQVSKAGFCWICETDRVNGCY